MACMQLVELKNGETYNGHMKACDTWMNIHLHEVICTSKVRLAGDTGNPNVACARLCKQLTRAQYPHGMRRMEHIQYHIRPPLDSCAAMRYCMSDAA